MFVLQNTRVKLYMARQAIDEHPEIVEESLGRVMTTPWKGAASQANADSPGALTIFIDSKNHPARRALFPPKNARVVEDPNVVSH